MWIRAVRIHDKELKTAGNQPVEYNLGSIRGPRRSEVTHGVVGQLHHVRSIRVHHADLKVRTVLPGALNDAGAVW